MHDYPRPLTDQTMHLLLSLCSKRRTYRELIKALIADNKEERVVDKAKRLALAELPGTSRFVTSVQPSSP